MGRQAKCERAGLLAISWDILRKTCITNLALPNLAT